eukprot:6716612-Prymnesium_polylepis.1
MRLIKLNKHATSGDADGVLGDLKRAPQAQRSTAHGLGVFAFHDPRPDRRPTRSRSEESVSDRRPTPPNAHAHIKNKIPPRTRAPAKLWTSRCEIRAP